MSTSVIVAIVVVVVVVLALIVGLVLLSRRRKSQKLQEDFGPEYDRAVEQKGDRKEAEASLEQRREQRKELDIRPLDPQARERYAESWRRTQTRFVDEPEAAVRESDQLVNQVMRERGYPVNDFESGADSVSVDHPEVASNYRSAHEISRRNERGEATTEDLRQALVHYRSLFEELLEQRGAEHPEGAR
jgi:FtsZ-interacting cell division protein ZipA